VDASHEATTARGADSNHGCDVCRRLGDTLFANLRHDQLQLASRERDQTIHAQTGGFCPLHSWEYVAMASPVGISAGYARLAESTAARLHALLQPSATADELAHGVADLVNRTEDCPICATLAETEHEIIAKIASTTPQSGPTLCLRHLVVCLSLG
jgi:hypothetical protein